MMKNRVIVSYSYNDKHWADMIIDQLSSNGIEVVSSSYEFSMGTSITENIRSLISSSDFVIILLSTNYSSWQEFEILKSIENNLSKRDITILPVILEKSKMPQVLESYQYIDLTKDKQEGIVTLISKIKNSMEIDFSKISPNKFEDLTYDLLDCMGFTSIQRNIMSNGNEIDIIAQFPYTDPFGSKELETWVIECRLYLNTRVDIKTINQLQGILMSNKSYSKGLLITNGYITSAALRFVQEIKENNRFYIKTIEGNELKRLLFKNEKLIQKYFY